MADLSGMHAPLAATAPIIGVTPDVNGPKYEVARAYADRVAEAGGVPIVLSAQIRLLPAYLALCDGFILTGGDDPDTTQWDEPLHPEAKPIDPDRQRFEWALLEHFEQSDHPVLGVCLGMQLMAIKAGGHLVQFLPDTLVTAADHWGRRPHPVEGELGTGIVHSHHRQAIDDAGRLRVIARAPDGVIEAVDDPDHPYFLGIQWHPERTEHPGLGADLFARLVETARSRRAAMIRLT